VTDSRYTDSTGSMRQRKLPYRAVKRTFDILISLVLIVLFSLPMLIIAILIRLETPGPAIFRQNRVGRDGKLFRICKFRSMYCSAPSEVATGQLENADSHITKMGNFLRKSSLDELPQIAQIFTGKMSIVGPRPALWNQDDLIAERDKYGANDVTPGLTGWAQINGRDELEIDVKARLDGEYANNISLGFDLKIFFMTLANVLKGSGVMEGGPAAGKENRK